MAIANKQLNLVSGIRLIDNQGKVMKIILGIIAAIVILVALLIYLTSGISGLAKEQLSDIKSGNIEAAYNLTSKAFKEKTTLDDFKNFVAQYPILKNYKSVTFSERRIENGQGYLAGTIEDADGSQLKIEYLLVKEDNQWKIQGLQLSPAGK